MKRIWRFIINADLLLSCTALVCLVIVTFTGVFARYLFNAPYIWGEEIMLALIIWVVWFAGSAIFRCGNPLCVEIFVDLLPKRIQKIITALICLTSVVLLTYLFIQSINFVQLMYRTSRATQVLRLPRWLMYSCIPISCALMIINMVSRAFTALCKGKDNNAEGGELS